MPACGPHQCEERLNGTPQAGLTWQEGPRWRASARPSWRRLTRPKGTAAVTHGPRISRCRESRAPLAAAWLRRGGISTAEEEQLADMSRQGRRIIPALTIPARPPSSHRQPARHRSLGSCKDQLTSITIFRLRRRLRRQPTGWHTERRECAPRPGRGPITMREQKHRVTWFPPCRFRALRDHFGGARGCAQRSRF